MNTYEHSLRSHEALLTLRQPSRLFMLAAGRHTSIGMTQAEVLGELMGVPALKVSDLISAETTKTNLEEDNTTQEEEEMDTDMAVDQYSDSSRYRYTPSPSSSIDGSYNY